MVSAVVVAVAGAHALGPGCRGDHHGGHPRGALGLAHLARARVRVRLRARVRVRARLRLRLRLRVRVRARARARAGGMRWASRTSSRSCAMCDGVR